MSSKRSADLVAGCIGEKWLMNEIPSRVASVKTERGWLITSREGVWTFGVAEIVPEGAVTTVRYSSGFIAYAEKIHIPAINSCVV